MTNSGMGGEYSICTTCIKICHAKHDVKYVRYGLNFCDCGEKGERLCKALKTFDDKALSDDNKCKTTRKLEASPQTQPDPREPIPPHPPGCQPQLGNSRAPTPPPPFVPPSPPPTLVSRPQSPSTSVPGKFHNVKNIRGKRLFFGFQKAHFC